MTRTPLILTLLLTAASATAAPLPLADNLPAGKNGALAYLGKETKTTAPLALTLKPEGGATVALIPAGGSVTALLDDGKGHILAANHFGLTGWAQPATAAAGNDDFPVLEVSAPGKDTEETPAFLLHYLPALGKAAQETYYLDENGKQHQGTPPEGKPEEASPYYEVYDHLLDTALKSGGATYRIDCSAGMSDDYHCLFQREGSARADAPTLGGQDYYLPGNGYVYTDYDDSGSSYYRKRQKWELAGNTFKEVPQPYYYLGLDSAYHGDDNQATGTLDKKATLTLMGDDGKKVATLKAGDTFTLLLADARHDCPADARIGDKNDPICTEARLLIKTADGTLGWLTLDYSKDAAPRIDGLHPLAG